MITHSASRRPLLALTGAGLILALSAAGCRIDVNADGPGPAAAETEQTGPRTASSPADGGETPTARQADGGDPAVCAPEQLIAEVHEQPSDSEEKVLAILTLSNKSERRCLLPAGWAPLGQGGGGGPHYGAVEGAREPHPNAGMRIIVRPGATAYAGLKWGTSPDCASAGGWAVSWGGTWLPAEVSWQNGQRDICPGTLTQGTLQPAPNDVNYS